MGRRRVAPLAELRSSEVKKEKTICQMKLSLPFLFLNGGFGWAHVRQVASSWKATPGLTLVNQAILCGLPYSSLPFIAIRSHHSLWPSQINGSDGQELSLKVNIVDQVLRALFVSFWASPTWAHIFFGLYFFVSLLTPHGFQWATPIMGLFLSKPHLFLLFLFFFHLLSFKIIYIVIVIINT